MQDLSSGGADSRFEGNLSGDCVGTVVKHPTIAPRTGRPEVNIDVPAVVGQFLNDLSRVDLIVELVQKTSWTPARGIP